jgi:hypothetical protein
VDHQLKFLSSLVKEGACSSNGSDGQPWDMMASAQNVLSIVIMVVIHNLKAKDEKGRLGFLIFYFSLLGNFIRFTKYD